MKAIFSYKEYIYDRMLSKTCINEINLQYYVIKHCWNVWNIMDYKCFTFLDIFMKDVNKRQCRCWRLPSKAVTSACSCLFYYMPLLPSTLKQANCKLRPVNRCYWKRHVSSSRHLPQRGGNSHVTLESRNGCTLAAVVWNMSNSCQLSSTFHCAL